jgi:hypothetical protein
MIQDPPLWKYLLPGTEFIYSDYTYPSTITYIVEIRLDTLVGFREEQKYEREERGKRVRCRNLKRFLVDKEGKIYDYQFQHEDDGEITSQTETRPPPKTDLFIPNPYNLTVGDIVSVDDMLATVAKIDEVINGRRMVIPVHRF